MMEVVKPYFKLFFFFILFEVKDLCLMKASLGKCSFVIVDILILLVVIVIVI